jgi:hypothetical protein
MEPFFYFLIFTFSFLMNLQLKYLVGLIGILIHTQSSSQLIDVIVENYGSSTGTYPAGHTTYRVYARLQHSNDFVAAVYGVGGVEGDPLHSLMICDNVYEEGSTTCWNSPFGGVTGPNINPAFCGIFPETCYDSFITIGRQNSTSPGGPINLTTNPTGQFDLTFGNSNSTGYPVEINDGSWSASLGDVNGYPSGYDNRVLLMQVTCPTGTLEFQINLLIYDAGNPANPLYYVHELQDIAGMYNGLDEISGHAIGLWYPIPTCYFSVPGCTNPYALNYDPMAACEDGSCIFPESGCTYPIASNYNPFVQTDDGSCLFDGCTDPLASNYNELANHDDGSCEYEFPCPGDLNGDGTVGVPDLLVIIGNYGSNCP